MQGTKVNGYTLQYLLGTGGMAEVWYAENKIGKKAAVKFLLPRFCADDNIVARFENEAKVMVELEHPNIRQVDDYDMVNGRPCIIMEYLEGDDLKAMMKHGRCFTDEELVKWWNQMVSALNYTHALGIVHRDIKPSNIFIDKLGNVRLLDFGIAKNNEGGSGTQTGSTLGTRIYMSPEQVKDPKRVDYRSDHYSLAVTFVHLLTGKAPYDSTTSSDFEIQMSIVTKPMDLAVITDPWRGFLESYLKKEPNDRAPLRSFSPTKPQVETPSREESASGEETIIGDATPHDRIGGNQYYSPQPQNGYRPDRNEVSQARMNAARERAKTEAAPLSFSLYGVSFDMIKVEGGTFLMGASDGGFFRSPDKVKNYDPEAWKDEKPVHTVTLDDYYISETEVTQALWEAVMRDAHTSYGRWEEQYGLGGDFPVYRVSWDDAQDFIQKLNAITKRQFRLPTEAEWEYAARGGKHASDFKYAGDNQIGAVAWYDGNSDGRTHPVKQKAANALGLYDMSGNVSEWCQDCYGAYDIFPQTNPCGSTKGSTRVLRGGSWRNEARSCRVSARFVHWANGRYNGYGFRLALTQ